MFSLILLRRKVERSLRNLSGGDSIPNSNEFDYKFKGLFRHNSSLVSLIRGRFCYFGNILIQKLGFFFFFF